MNESREDVENEVQESELEIAKPASARRDDDDIVAPPTEMNRGPMDQTTPDVATGSTPITRRDD
jgi:hypothetical protein